MEVSVMRIILLTLCLLLFAVIPAYALVTGRDIMGKNDSIQSLRFEESTLTMKLINKNGRERIRRVEQKIANNDKGLRNRFIYFLEPGDIKGTKLLTLENKGEDDTQWFYLPAIKQARRISAAENTDSFVGSELSFEDLRRERLDEYSYKLIGEDKIDGQECYVIEAVPKNEKSQKISGYSRREIWIHKDNYINVQVKFYDKNNKMLKYFKASEIRKLSSGDWKAHQIYMENVQTSHKTILEYDDFKINQQIDDQIFSVRYLNR